MFSAICFISEGRESGTPLTHSTRSERVISHTLSREIPLRRGSLALSHNLDPWQQGQVLLLRNLSTLFIPFSSLTLARAFSTV